MLERRTFQAPAAYCASTDHPAQPDTRGRIGGGLPRCPRCGGAMKAMPALDRFWGTLFDEGTDEASIPIGPFETQAEALAALDRAIATD